MNEEFVDLCDRLNEFHDDRDHFESLVNETQMDILNLNRVVKKEVIDMSDLMDKMSKMMLQQAEQIKNQASELNQIRKLVGGGEDAEDK